MTDAESCTSCDASKSCNVSGTLVWARSATRLEPGQAVRVQMRPAAILKATGWVYGVPLVGLIAGVLVGQLWLFAATGEGLRVGLSTLLGIGLMVGAAYLVSRRDRHLSGNLTAWARPDRGHLVNSVPS